MASLNTVNLITASKTVLLTLHGVGETSAHRILELRRKGELNFDSLVRACRGVSRSQWIQWFEEGSIVPDLREQSALTLASNLPGVGELNVDSSENIESIDEDDPRSSSHSKDTEENQKSDSSSVEVPKPRTSSLPVLTAVDEPVVSNALTDSDRVDTTEITCYGKPSFSQSKCIVLSEVGNGMAYERMSENSSITGEPVPRSGQSMTARLQEQDRRNRQSLNRCNRRNQQSEQALDSLESTFYEQRLIPPVTPECLRRGQRSSRDEAATNPYPGLSHVYPVNNRYQPQGRAEALGSPQMQIGRTIVSHSTPTNVPVPSADSALNNQRRFNPNVRFDSPLVNQSRRIHSGRTTDFVPLQERDLAVNPGNPEMGYGDDRSPTYCRQDRFYPSSGCQETLDYVEHRSPYRSQPRSRQGQFDDQRRIQSCHGQRDFDYYRPEYNYDRSPVFYSREEWGNQRQRFPSHFSQRDYYEYDRFNRPSSSYRRNFTDDSRRSFFCADQRNFDYYEYDDRFVRSCSHNNQRFRQKADPRESWEMFNPRSHRDGRDNSDYRKSDNRFRESITDPFRGVPIRFQGAPGGDPDDSGDDSNGGDPRYPHRNDHFNNHSRRERSYRSNNRGYSRNNGESGNSYREPSLKMPTYDGSRKWRPFINQFEGIANRFNWSIHERFDRLCECMRGEALEFFDSLDVGHDYFLIVEKFMYEFQKDETPTTARMNLAMIHQDEGESLEDYSKRVRKIVRYGFPGGGEEFWSRMSVDPFLFGCLDDEARKTVINQKPNTLSEATDLMKQAEASGNVVTRTSRSKKSRTSVPYSVKKVDLNNSSDSDSPGDSDSCPRDVQGKADVRSKVSRSVPSETFSLEELGEIIREECQKQCSEMN